MTKEEREERWRELARIDDELTLAEEAERYLQGKPPKVNGVMTVLTGVVLIVAGILILTLLLI